MVRVSIHAPAWGATQRLCRTAQITDVSIHAPAWGATQKYWRNIGLMCRFNPRARVGRDVILK